MLFLLLLTRLDLFAQTNTATSDKAGGGPAAFSAAARKEFEEARERYVKESKNNEAAWQYGRACFDLADFAQSKKERAQIAQLGIAACEQLLKRETNSAQGHYYLGLNLGQLARTKSLGALKLVSRMEREFKMAAALDEHLDEAGPDRTLGLLYRDAPSIGSVGDRALAREHLERAVKLAPGFPENRLNLAESEIRWGEREAAARELKELEAALPKARAQWKEAEWASSWADWEQRLAEVQKKLGAR